MTDETREFVLGEEVEFVHKDTTYVYSFRSRESRITFKRIWNPPEAEVDVYPNASLVAVNIAILVLYKAATWKSGVPMPQFIPALLSKLLAGFTLIDELEKNMKGVIRTFSTFGGGTEEGEDAIAKIDALMKFLEPYTPWAVPPIVVLTRANLYRLLRPARAHTIAQSSDPQSCLRLPILRLTRNLFTMFLSYLPPPRPSPD